MTVNATTTVVEDLSESELKEKQTQIYITGLEIERETMSNRILQLEWENRELLVNAEAARATNRSLTERQSKLQRAWHSLRIQNDELSYKVLGMQVTIQELEEEASIARFGKCINSCEAEAQTDESDNTNRRIAELQNELDEKDLEIDALQSLMAQPACTEDIGVQVCFEFHNSYDEYSNAIFSSHSAELTSLFSEETIRSPPLYDSSEDEFTPRSRRGGRGWDRHLDDTFYIEFVKALVGGIERAELLAGAVDASERPVKKSICGPLIDNQFCTIKHGLGQKLLRAGGIFTTVACFFRVGIFYRS